MAVLKAPAYFNRRLRAIARRNSPRWKGHTSFIDSKARATIWETRRTYKDYNIIFSQGLGMPIATALHRLHGGRKRPIRVLDDGAGRGIFLEELKREMQTRYGIPVISTALSLTRDPWLLEKMFDGKISELRVGRAESFQPKRQFDAIFSLFGAFSYVLPKARKDYLLKLAHSLRRGGILMIGFEFREKRPSAEFPRGMVIEGLSGEPTGPRDLLGGLKLKQEMDGIVQAFSFRGFDARFEKVKKKSDDDLPNWTLIVERR